MAIVLSGKEAAGGDENCWQWWKPLEVMEVVGGGENGSL